MHPWLHWIFKLKNLPAFSISLRLRYYTTHQLLSWSSINKTNKPQIIQIPKMKPSHQTMKMAMLPLVGVKVTKRSKQKVNNILNPITGELFTSKRKNVRNPHHAKLFLTMKDATIHTTGEISSYPPWCIHKKEDNSKNSSSIQTYLTSFRPRLMKIQSMTRKLTNCMKMMRAFATQVKPHWSQS